MIEITIKLKSAISPDRDRVLGVATIINDATSGSPDVGNYRCALSKWEPKLGETWKRGRVEGFDRRRRGGWDLLYLALKACLGNRNEGA